MLTATVVSEFKEVQHDGHVYKVGDAYPAEGFTADQERVDFLSKVHPTYKKIFLANVKVDEEPNSTAGEVNNYPKHSGGGWYELSNGEKIQGKEEAIAAENELKSGE